VTVTQGNGQSKARRQQSYLQGNGESKARRWMIDRYLQGNGQSKARRWKNGGSRAAERFYITGYEYHTGMYR
jgi:hypothetical protein